MAIKLIYFDLGGRALPIRLAFHYGNVEFEDFRCARENWPALKGETPLGQVPVIEVNGKQHTQSDAILRFAANKAGLKVASFEEGLLVDEAINLLYELFSTLPREPNQEAREAWVSGKATTNLKRIDDFIAASGSGFVAPSGVSIADFAIFGYFNLISLGFFDFVPKDLATRFPNVKGAMEKIQQLPQLQKFFEAHPGEKAFTA